MKSLAATLLCVASPFCAAAQFEAADIHISPPDATSNYGFLPGGRAEFRAVTLLGLIAVAYSLPPDRVAGGPPWIDTDRFDVVAKAAGQPNEAAMTTMLQSLLEDRFGLRVRREDKPRPVFALVAGRRTSAKPVTSGDPGCKRAIEEGILTLTCRNTTMAALADSLQGAAPAYFPHPVVDRSGLKGAFDFRLEWAGRGQLPPGPAGLTASQSIFSSIEKELGLKIESSTEPMPVLTILSANRVPTPNPPGVTEKLGPPPTEFDVADIRPTRPDAKEDFRMDNGRIDAKGILLKDLIQFAYNVEDDALKGADKWLDSERFDLVAKTAPTASPDTLRVMLRSLLAERFALKVHQDRQPVTVYALTAVKPKLNNADPAERSTCRLSMENGERSYICQNVTLAQFTDKIRDVAGGYFEHPVVDLTGLTGHYDFTVTWAPRNRTLGRAKPPAPGENASAAGPAPTGSDPNSELTIFEAVQRQMGLKLAVQKQPMPVVVIDHVNRTPSAN
jgi:uncharacterized protein (TIGR03435 family)